MRTVNNHDDRESLSWGGTSEETAVSRCISDDFQVHGILNVPHNRRNVSEEHDYATPNQNNIAEEHDYATPRPLRFVSSSSYYGYHPTLVLQESSFDCLMDTSENCSPPEDGMLTIRARKRDSDSESDHRSTKRPRRDEVEEASSVPEVQGCGFLAPSFGVQNQNHPQNLDLSSHQVPASSSVLMDTVTPRPRCLMGHFI